MLRLQSAHCSHKPDAPTSSCYKARRRTSMPGSPTMQTSGVRLARTEGQLFRCGPHHLEPKPFGHTKDARGKSLLGHRFYGCVVPRLYNTIGPHEALGCKPPALETWINEMSWLRAASSQETTQRRGVPLSPSSNRPLLQHICFSDRAHSRDSDALRSMGVGNALYQFPSIRQLPRVLMELASSSSEKYS